MTTPRSFLLLTPILFAASTHAANFAPSSPDEPKAATLSMERAAGYLDEVPLDWTRTRQCGTCHTNAGTGFAVMALKACQ